MDKLYTRRFYYNGETTFEYRPDAITHSIIRFKDDASLSHIFQFERLLIEAGYHLTNPEDYWPYKG